MSKQALIVELITEELPPKALQKLGAAFANSIFNKLKEQNLVNSQAQSITYATPRRLAVYIDAALKQAPEQKYTEKLMPVRIGQDEQGKPSAALTKKLAAKGLSHLDLQDLVIRNDGKQDMFYAEGTAAGATLQEGLQQALDYAITHLPIPKVMQYQLSNGESVKFVRPVHKLLALFGTDIIPVNALGLTAGRTSMGHRFMSSGAIEINSADSWFEQLSSSGKIMPLFAQRRAMIEQELHQAASSLGATIGQEPETIALLDEVTALVEYPSIYVGEFESEFLDVPAECLILTMRLNQKYFPLFNQTDGKLSNKFLIVSNMALDNPKNIIEGNQKVIRPRLADAQFFYETDLKIKLADRVAKLDNSVYHNKLGSELKRTERIKNIAGWLAPILGADPQQAERAALLAHADLNTLMVGEFPELQGIIGAYYARHGQEPEAVALALNDQYKNRINTRIDEQHLVSTVLFMAIRAETLIGIWGIGLAPTGERDPYGLRRAALGLISAYEQLTESGWLIANKDTNANLKSLLQFAYSTFSDYDLEKDTVSEVLGFIFERYRNQLAKQFDNNVIAAVLAMEPPIHQVFARIKACEEFTKLPEAVALSAANKRVANLLKKSESNNSDYKKGLLSEPAEIELANTIESIGPQAKAELESGNFAASLAILAQARNAVDKFFAEVMVMDKDLDVRHNRLALLQSLHNLMQQVADISRLAN